MAIETWYARARAFQIVNTAATHGDQALARVHWRLELAGAGAAPRQFEGRLRCPGHCPAAPRPALTHCLLACAVRAPRSRSWRPARTRLRHAQSVLHVHDVDVARRFGALTGPIREIFRKFQKFDDRSQPAPRRASPSTQNGGELLLSLAASACCVARARLDEPDGPCAQHGATFLPAGLRASCSHHMCQQLEGAQTTIVNGLFSGAAAALSDSSPPGAALLDR